MVVEIGVSLVVLGSSGLYIRVTNLSGSDPHDLDPKLR